MITVKALLRGLALMGLVGGMWLANVWGTAAGKAVAQPPLETPPPLVNQLPVGQGQMVAEEASVEPQRITVAWQDQLPPMSAEQQAIWANLENEREFEGPSIPAGHTAVQRADSVASPETQTQLPTEVTFFDPRQNVGAPNAAPVAPGTLMAYRSTTIAPSGLSGATSVVNEPTVANSGPVVMMTGNWYAALSSNGGQTFQYINPYTTFPASEGGFCCDQVVLYEPSRDLFVWYLQYVADADNNRFRIAVASSNDAKVGSWCYYDFASATGYWYDFPDLSTGNNYVYATTNRFTMANAWNNTYIFRLPLDALATCSGFSYNFYSTSSNFTFRLARGATDTIYWASHNTTSQIRIFHWSELTTTLGYDDVNLSAAWTIGTGVCPGPDARDWCGRADSRILAGWVANGEGTLEGQRVIGFMWNAPQGGSFAYPYIEAVRVKEADRSYINRPLVWNSGVAFQYPAASSNARGDVAIAGFYGGGSSYPNVFLSVDDDYNGAPPGWELLTGVTSSSQGPTQNAWGDYLSVRPLHPSGLGWTASAYDLFGCGGTGCVWPYFVAYGRERDLRAATKYLNPLYGVFLPMSRR